MSHNRGNIVIDNDNDNISLMSGNGGQTGGPYVDEDQSQQQEDEDQHNSQPQIFVEDKAFTRRKPLACNLNIDDLTKLSAEQLAYCGEVIRTQMLEQKTVHYRFRSMLIEWIEASKSLDDDTKYELDTIYSKSHSFTKHQSTLSQKFA